MNSNVLESSPIASRNWQSVLEVYQASAPFNYAVMDNFLHPDICHKLHQELLNHWGWSYQEHLEHPVISNTAPEIETIFMIAESLKAHCSSLLLGYELVEYWALIYPKNAPGKVHSDIGAITLNIWLTPEQYNLDSSSGGLIFFDVKRQSEAASNQSVSYLWSEQYLKDFTQGQKATVNYKWNRALLFDAKTFHQTDTFCFANLKPDSHRINLSLAFDNPELYGDRVDSFKKVLKSSQSS
ncbi:hypothetical protein ACWATR_35945 [Nostoc sp. UIC 10890]